MAGWKAVNKRNTQPPSLFELATDFVKGRPGPKGSSDLSRNYY